jgi:hypothetical protein
MRVWSLPGAQSINDRMCMSRPRAADMNQGMPQNPYFVTATPTTVRKHFVRKPLIKHIIDRAVQITNIEDALQEHWKRDSVNSQYVLEQNATAKRYKNDLQRYLLRFFHDCQLSTKELDAITQTVLDKTIHFELYKLYYVDEPTQQDLMEMILQDAVELARPKQLT